MAATMSRRAGNMAGLKHTTRKVSVAGGAHDGSPRSLQGTEMAGLKHKTRTLSVAGGAHDGSPRSLQGTEMAGLKHKTRTLSVAGEVHDASPRSQQGTEMAGLKHKTRKVSVAGGAHDGSPRSQQGTDTDMAGLKQHKTRTLAVAGGAHDGSPQSQQGTDMAGTPASDKVKLKNTKRKRSLADSAQSLHDEGDGEPQTKQGKTNVEFISEVEFKFLLSDKETVIEGLEKFIRSAEAVTETSSDIVAGYCRSSQACSELFALIDPSSPKMKINELALVFRCLELVLTRIRTDLLKLSSTAEAIVQKLLAGHMGQVYNCLQDQNKSKTIKAALRLLTSMVQLSDRAKKAVQSRLNFAHVNFPSIFRRRNRKDPDDVRSCAVALTLSFLQDSDLSTISLLVQQKTFLQQVIGGLKYDRRDLVLEVLATLLDKVVTFHGLTKTDKVKLFSETVLKQLCELYDWQGPSGWVPRGKKKQKEEEVRVIPEGFSEDQEMVANVAHAFLMEVCCSHTHGLNFYDKSLGTGLRNYNQLLAHLVDWLVKKMDKPKIADLIIGILCACPDLLKSTLTNLCPSLTPRWSDKWRQLMSWVTKLYRKLPDIPQFLSSLDYLKEDHTTIVSMATVFCLPPTNVAAILIQGLKHDDLRVRDKCAHLIQGLAKKACAVQDKLSLDATSSTAAAFGHDGSILDLFSAMVMKSLPPASQLFVCVDKTMQLMSAKHDPPGQLDTSVLDEAVPAVDLSQHASVLLQVLGLYQTLLPSLLSERPRDTAKLVDMVGCLQRHHQGQAPADGSPDTEHMDVDENNRRTDDQGWLPQLYLLKLLSDTDARKISLGREGLLEKLLLSANQSDKVKDLTKGLICKMLQSMEIFSGHGTELDTWLDLAMSPGSHRQTDPDVNPASSTLFKPTLFLARCLATLINNPLPYVDRIMEAEADTGRPDLDMDSVSVCTNESAIEAVLLMEDEELGSKLDNCPPLTSNPQVDIIRLPLSPLTVVALDNLQFGKSGNDADTEYVSKVLVHLLHSLPVPATLARIVATSEAKLCEGVAAYLKYWTCGKNQKQSLTQPLPAAIFGKFTSALMSQHFGLKSANMSARLSNQIPRMSNQERLTALRQVLLYVRDTLQTSQRVAGVEATTAYLGVASSLLEHILEESHNHGKHTSSWIKALSASTGGVHDDANDSGPEAAVFDVLFAQFMTSSTASHIAEGCKWVLLNPKLKSWLFKTVSHVVVVAGSKKSPKQQNRLAHVVSISESVSEFVSNVITMARQGSWMKSEHNLVEEYVKLALDGLVSQRLSPKLEEVCGQVLESLSPLLNLRTLSKCVVQLLQLPLSYLLGEGSSDVEHVGSSADTPSCRALCELLKHLKKLLETDPLFVSQQQTAKLLSPGIELEADSREFVLDGNRKLTSELASCALVNEFKKHEHRLKGCIQVRTTFRFEDSSGQMVSSFAPVFLLLPRCENEHLVEFVVFALSHIPETAPLVQPTLFEQLFKNPLALAGGSLGQRLFTSLIQHVRGCFELYEQWLATHVNTVVKRDKWFLMMTYLQAHSNFSAGYSPAVEAVKFKASSCLQTLDVARLSQSMPCWKLLSLTVHNHDPQFQRLLVDTITCHVRRHESCQQLHFDVLRIASGFCERENSGAPQGGQSSQAFILDLVLDYLTYLITGGGPGDRDLEEYIVNMALHLMPQLVKSSWTSLLASWEHLVQEALRHRLTDGKILQLVTSLAEHILPLGSQVTTQDSVGSAHSAAQHLFEQCVDHPMFTTVMTSGEFTRVKDQLVKLLHAAGDLNPSCYRSTELAAVLASAYTASLSLTDQRLLLMMKRCSQNNGVDFECPVLWSKSATEHQSVSEVLGPSLYKQATTQVILEQLNPALMQQSILSFPVRRQYSSDLIVDASEFKGKPTCYDPSFLLRLFRQILSPDKQVPMRLFVEKDCLSYLLIALSSHDQCTRLHAYHALNDFYLHAEGARWHEKMEICFVLDLLTASRVKDGQKLSFLVALFFARTVKLFLYPGDPMYVPIFRFLMVKPQVDLSSVPEFYKLFFSAEVQFKQERNWMLTLLADGIRETSDYWLYQKKFVFKIIFAFYDSAISDAHSQELVLRTVKNACKEKSVAVDLVQNHGLMPWLVAAASSLDRRPEHAGHLCDITHTLWYSLTTTRYPSHPHPPVVTSSSRAAASQVQASDSLHGVLEKEPDSGDDSEVKDASIVGSQHDAPLGGARSDEDSQDEVTLDPDSSDEDSQDEVPLDADSSDEDSQDEVPLDGASSDEDSQDDHLVSDQSTSQGQVRLPEGAVAQTLPRSTAVEMALLVKCLIPHLSKTSREGLVKTVEVFYRMILHQTCNSQAVHSSTEQTTDSPSRDLVNLSPLESCLLLYHVATAVQQPAVAEAAASVLTDHGISFLWTAVKADRKSSRNVKSLVVKNDDHDVAELEEERTESAAPSGGHVGASETSDANTGTDTSTGVLTSGEARRLFGMLYDIVSTTNTIQFL